MSGYEITAITRTGVKSRKFTGYRMTKPVSGDHVRWHESTGITSLGRVLYGPGTGLCDDDEVLVCHSQGSAFFHDDGTVDISGGPFRMVKLTELAPTYELHLGVMWNWGDNLPGADQGVDFALPRPIFAHTPEG